MDDLESSSLSNAEKVMLRFVDKVNHDSVNVTPDDMQILYASGWNDEQIYYAITICSLFNFYNRWIDAAGVHALSDATHREGAKRSAIHGYVRK